MSVVPQHFRAEFIRGGWCEGRETPVDTTVPQSHPARAVLAELTGVRLTRPGDDIVEVDFKYIKDNDPLIIEWASALGMQIVGIAEAHNAHGELYITDRGHVIGSSIIHGACWFQGRSFAEAMEAILSGTRSRPMLLPGQTEMMLYGNTFRHGDAALITPGSPELR
jgi:hypothetical protein